MSNGNGNGNSNCDNERNGHRKDIEGLSAKELELLPKIEGASTLKPAERLLDVRISNVQCVRPPFGCGQPVDVDKDFRDPLSVREFGISGLCQKCQDSIFGL